MPCAYAHYLFGSNCISSLKEKYQNIILHHRNEFDYGVQGPDIFFFYSCLKPTDVTRFGFKMHDMSGKEIMERFGKSLKKAKNKEGCLSYLLGFLAHFALDSYCHSYVEAKDKIGGVPHARIETQFDRYLMLNNGLNPIRYNPTITLKPTRECIENIAEMYPDIQKKDVGRAMKDQKFYLNVLKDSNKGKRKLLRMALSNKKTEYYLNLLVGETTDERCRDSNLRLLKLMNKAREHYGQLAKSLLDYLESGKELSSYFLYNLNEHPGWEKIPLLSFEDEQKFEVQKQD